MYLDKACPNKVCPDKELLSAYFDAELDQKYMEQIRAHVMGCPSCMHELERFAVLRKSMNAIPLPVDVLKSKERTLLLVESSRLLYRRERGESFWSRRVFIPVPALAGFGLLLLFAFAVFIMGGIQPQEPSIAEIKEAEGPYDMDVKNLEQLAEFLKSSNSTVEITIRLPEQPAFFSVGEPQLLREADYKRGR